MVQIQEARIVVHLKADVARIVVFAHMRRVRCDLAQVDKQRIDIVIPIVISQTEGKAWPLRSRVNGKAGANRFELRRCVFIDCVEVVVIIFQTEVQIQFVAEQAKPVLKEKSAQIVTQEGVTERHILAAKPFIANHQIVVQEIEPEAAVDRKGAPFARVLQRLGAEIYDQII